MPGSPNTHAFASVGLDEILQITQADNDNAHEIAGQAEAVSELNARVATALTDIRHAARSIGDADWRALEEAFAGESAAATLTQLRKLSDISDTAHRAMEPQPKAFSALAQQVIDTHQLVRGMRDERNHWLSVLRDDPENPELNATFGGFAGRLGLSDPAELERAIRDRYDGDARDVMSATTAAYQGCVDQLPSVPSYSGPRVARPQPNLDIVARETDDQSGPLLAPRSEVPPIAGPAGAPPDTRPGMPPADAGAAAPDLQSGAATPAVTTPGPNVGPAPVGDVFVPSKPVVPPVIGARHGPSRATGGIPSRPITANPGRTPGLTPRGSSNLYPPRGPMGGIASRGSSAGLRSGGVPSRGTMPPIGSRSGASVPRPAPVRQPDGLSRPVIGGRGANPVGRSAAVPGGTRPVASVPKTWPVRQPDGLSRPVIGGRPAPSTGQAARQPNGQTGSTAPRANPTARPNGSGRPPVTEPEAPRAGVRARLSQPHEPRGRVFGRRSGAVEVTAVEFNRTPRIVHGGNDNPNRSVVRNSRSVSPPRTDDERTSGNQGNERHDR